MTPPVIPQGIMKLLTLSSYACMQSLVYVTGFAKRDKFFKIEFSSHLRATRIALNSDLSRACHTLQPGWLSRKTDSVANNIRITVCHSSVNIGHFQLLISSLE